MPAMFKQTEFDAMHSAPAWLQGSCSVGICVRTAGIALQRPHMRLGVPVAVLLAVPGLSVQNMSQSV